MICSSSSWLFYTDVMEYKELEKILTEYIRRFDEFDDKNTRNEGYKWRAIAHFQRNWNIDAEQDSFLQMFKEATKWQINLFDGQNKHPLNGIRKLLKEHDEYDFIHQQFSLLFSDDSGDYDQRQERAQRFIEAVNSQLYHFYPTDEPSTHTLYDAINYLSFWRPEDNFICKPTSANKMANAIDFSGDIGWGEDFSLAEYYKMCNEILAALDDFPKVLERNEARRLRESPDLSDAASRHIIVYDVIYCAYQYDLNGTKNRPSVPRKERLAIAEARRKWEARENEVATLREQLRMAEEVDRSLPDLSGQVVHHKTFGKGIVRSCTDKRLVINFQSKDEPVVFEYLPDKNHNCVLTRFITPDDSGVAEAIRAVFESKDEVPRLKAQLSSAEIQLSSAEKELNGLLNK